MLEGLPPNGAAHVMRLECDEATARRVVDILFESFDPAEIAAAAFEVQGTAPTWSGAPWSVEVFFAQRPDEAALLDLVTVAAGAASAARVVLAEVAKQDWVAASLEGLAAVREGRFVVHGSHGRPAVGIGDIGIEIEAALAFGTGHHGTTRGCLAALNEIARRRRPRHILDVGTGTGILAIAAARRFRRRVAAGDLDATAVAAARENVAKNRAHPFVRPVRATGLAHPALRASGPYDLVFANLLARPLRALAPAIRRRLTPGGEVILSGLLEGDVPGVVSAYRGQGLVLVRRSLRDGWATLLFRRPLR